MEIDIRMTQKDLFVYSVYNSNSGSKGIFNFFWTLGWLAALAGAWKEGAPQWQECAIMVFGVLLFTVIQPLVLWNKSRKQAQKAGFSEALHLTLTKDKILVERNGEKADFEWNRIRKMVRVRHLFVMDMGFGRAYLISKDAVRGREKELMEFCKDVLPRTKTKGLKA